MPSSAPSPTSDTSVRTCGSSFWPGAPTHTTCASARQRAGRPRSWSSWSPVGKHQLIDYYRSCDIVLDHFVYGYYGTTALEAAGIGKPVVMKLRADQDAALYRGDVAHPSNKPTRRIRYGTR